MRRVVRLSSETPRSRSRAAKVRTTVGNEVSSVSAAAVRLPKSTMRTKVVMAASLSMAQIITSVCGVVYCLLAHLFHGENNESCRGVPQSRYLVHEEDVAELALGGAGRAPDWC